MAEAGVVATRLTLGILMLFAEVRATRLATLECVQTYQLAQLQEIRHAPSALERLVQLLA